MLNKIKSGKGCIILRNKKIIYNICLIVTLVGLIAIISGTSYAVLKGNTSAEKEQVVQNGNVTVTLTEYFESINKKINILSDEEGLLQEDSYKFNIKNTGDIAAKYDIKLVNEVPSDYQGETIDEKYIKVGLEINGEEYGPFSLEEVENILDSGIIYKNELISYNLRLWLDESYKEELLEQEGAKIFYKIKVEAEQRTNISDTGSKATEFNYTGDSQEYKVTRDGYYYIEMAGASGGTINSTYPGGKGAKTSGYIYLEAGDKLYFYVGGEGKVSSTGASATGGYNGGGIAPAYTGLQVASGGGATDVRLVGGEWNNASSLISRIMVAAGGAGGTGSSTSYYLTEGFGGSLHGYQGFTTSTTYNTTTYPSGGGTQTSGGEGYNGRDGGFGTSYQGTLTGYCSGGGSGYYGGANGFGRSGGGGSSYISGYAGVNSVEESTTITHTNQTLHYSGKYFIGGKMIAGQNEGNGYAKITYVGEKPKRKTTKLNNVRYIKNCTNYSSYGNSNHWLEVQAIKDGVNIAKGKGVTGTTSESTSYPYSRITDGDITYTNYARPTSYSANQCITVDLGDTYDLDEIAVWNYFGDQRRYYDNITSVSSDNNSWTEVIDEASIETSNGHRINAYTDTYNGYISDNLTLWYDGYANTGSTRNMTTTTWKDLSGTGYNGTVSGATWYDKFLSFDGVNDTVTTTVAPNTVLSNTKDWTMSAYFKVNNVPKTNTTYGNAGAIFGASYYNGPGIFWYRTTTESNYNIYAGKRAANNIYHTHSMENYPIGTYHYITIVHDFTNKKIKIYDNTAKVFEDVLSPDETYTNISNIGNIGISKAQMLGGSYTQSYIGMNMYKAQIYNKALTEDEIIKNYLYDIEKFNLN